MNIEDIKVGETYFVNVKVTATSTNRFVCQPLLGGCTMSDFAPTYFNFAEAEAFYKSIPETTPPKYDPCRLFREGDEVRYVPYNGRECPAMPVDEYYREKTLTVVKDEDSNHQVLVRTQDGREKYIRFCYLQLVTPVEEVMPYSVSENLYGWVVFKDTPGNVVANFNNTHPNAKAAVEAECGRLNAEYRKEMGK